MQFSTVRQIMYHSIPCVTTPTGQHRGIWPNFALRAETSPEQDVWRKDQLIANANSIQWIAILTYFSYFVASRALGYLIILKMVGKRDIYQNKGSHRIPGARSWWKVFTRRLGFDECWKFALRLQGNVALTKYGRPVLWLAFYRDKSVPFKNQTTFGFLRQIILQSKLGRIDFWQLFWHINLELNLDEEQRTNSPWNGRSWG